MVNDLKLVLHVNAKPIVTSLQWVTNRIKTVEIRSILMEGHRERELLTTASTGN